MRYQKQRKTAWGLGTVVGMGLGLGIGVFIDNIPLGLIIGVFVGILLIVPGSGKAPRSR